MIKEKWVKLLTRVNESKMVLMSQISNKKKIELKK